MNFETFGLRALWVLGLILCPAAFSPTLLKAQPKLALQLGLKSYVESVSCSSDGRILATASRDNDVKLWDALTGEPYHFIFKHPSQVYAVTFGPDNTALATAGQDGELRLWNIDTGSLVFSVN